MKSLEGDEKDGNDVIIVLKNFLIKKEMKKRTSRIIY